MSERQCRACGHRWPSESPSRCPRCGSMNFADASPPPVPSVLVEEGERACSAVAFVLVGGDGRVLMERTPPEHKLYAGEWAFPSGRVEPGESPDEALRREMLEELDCVPLEFMPLPLVDCTARGSGMFLVRPYAVTLWGGTPPSVGGDGAPLSWRSRYDASASRIPQVRMMAAAALRAASPDGPPQGETLEEAAVPRKCPTCGTVTRNSFVHCPLPGLPDGERERLAAECREASDRLRRHGLHYGTLDLILLLDRLAAALSPSPRTRTQEVEPYPFETCIGCGQTIYSNERYQRWEDGCTCENCGEFDTPYTTRAQEVRDAG